MNAMHGAGSSWRTRLAAAAAIGGGAGLMTAFDGPIAHAFAQLWLAQQVPYALSVLAVACALVAAWGLRHRERIWRAQFALASVGIVWSLHMMAVDVGPINPFNVFAALISTLWLLHRLLDDAAPWAPSGLFHLTLFYLACALASAFDQSIFDILGGWLNLLPKLVLALVLTDVLYDRRHVDLAVQALVVSSAVAALLGIAQSALYWFYQMELTLMDPDAPRYVILAGEPLLRVSGLQHTPHSYALPLGVTAVLIFAGAVRGWHRAWLGVAGLACLIAVALSMVRGQWLGVVVALALLPFFAGRPQTIVMVWGPAALGVLLVGLASGLLPWAARALASVTESSGAVRMELLGAGVRAIMDHPLNGVGISNFGAFFPLFERYPVHNAPVQVASELGVLGGLIFVTVLAWVAARLVIGIRVTSDAPTRDQLKALLAGHVCMLIAMQFEPMAYSEFVWFYLVLADSAVRVAMRDARAGVKWRWNNNAAENGGAHPAPKNSPSGRAA